MRNRLQSNLMSNIFGVSCGPKIHEDYIPPVNNVDYYKYLASSIVVSEFVDENTIIFISPSDSDYEFMYLLNRGIEALKNSLFVLRTSISELDRENND